MMYRFTRMYSLMNAQPTLSCPKGLKLITWFIHSVGQVSHGNTKYPDIRHWSLSWYKDICQRAGTKHTCYGMGWNSCCELFYGMGINNCLKETCYIINNACGTNKVLACIDSIPYIYTSEWFTTYVTSLKLAKYYHGAIKMNVIPKKAGATIMSAVLNRQIGWMVASWMSHYNSTMMMPDLW